MGQLAEEGCHSVIREIEPGLTGIAADPDVGVGQRALVVSTAEGNLLWDPAPFVDDAALDAVRSAGGLAAISSSHPHMYGAAVQWSHAFDAPLLLPEADTGWLMRPDAAVRRWSGALQPLPGVTLVQCGGHFAGSSVLHWAAGAEGRGAILCGDTIFVTPGEDRVSFVYSAPVRLPLAEPGVRGIIEALAPYEFDRIYGGWWSPVIRRDAKRILEDSAARYIELLTSLATAAAEV
jgi:glyoxylase-like metal-dependent hydrolase (beta-lactamase superfamily II)